MIISDILINDDLVFLWSRCLKKLNQNSEQESKQRKIILLFTFFARRISEETDYFSLQL